MGDVIQFRSAAVTRQRELGGAYTVLAEWLVGLAALLVFGWLIWPVLVR